MTAFAAIESATATSAVAAFANATASINGSDYSVVFDEDFADTLGIVAGTRPTVLGLTSDLAAVAVGDVVTVNGGTYAVAEIQPDGTGLTRLMLKT